MKPLTKIYLFSVMALAMTQSTLALADQCQIVTRQQADAFVSNIRQGDLIGSLCEPCGETPDEAGGIPLITVNKIMVSGEGEDSEVYINDEGIDLAYTYIITAETSTSRTLMNAAKLVGCPCEDVSENLTIPR
jgi:hypothetical protein